MPYRNAPRGGPSAALPPAAFVSFIQNHDQIGNRAFGERLNSLAPPEAIRALASVYLLAPQTPMMFMGEEWGETQPVPVLLRLQGKARRRPSARDGARSSHVSRVRRSRTCGEDPRPIGGSDLPCIQARLEPHRRGASGLLSRRCSMRAANMSGRCCLPSSTAARRSCWASKRCASRGELATACCSSTPISRLAASSSRRSQAEFSGAAASRRRPGPWSVRWAIEPRMTIPRATYRLQLRAGFGFSAGGRDRALPRAARRQSRLSFPDLQGAARQCARL